jgi:predicted MFS family arabinose efflux permease
MGTSLDERWRARMFGWMTAIAAMIMLGVSVIIGNVLGNPGLEFPNNYALLFGASGVLFAISILPGIFFHELPGGKAVDKIPSLKEFLPQLWHVLRTDGPFRAIVIARMLTSLFAMSGPFYIGFATKQLGLSSQDAVPILLAMQTIGTIVGAVTYTRLGVKDNVLYIRIVLACGVLLPVSALLAAVVGPLPLYFGFFVSGLALSNLFFGYQNWVVGYATPDQRPIYAGLFNTAAALISITAPFIAGTITEKIGFEALFAVSIVMGLLALYVMVRYISRPRVEAPVALAAAD